MNFVMIHSELFTICQWILLVNSWKPVKLHIFITSSAERSSFLEN